MNILSNSTPTIIKQRGDYSVRDERTADYGAVTVWGPDINGRICRMSSHRCAGSALLSLDVLAPPK